MEPNKSVTAEDRNGCTVDVWNQALGLICPVTTFLVLRDLLQGDLTAKAVTKAGGNDHKSSDKKRTTKKKRRKKKKTTQGSQTNIISCSEREAEKCEGNDGNQYFKDASSARRTSKAMLVIVRGPGSEGVSSGPRRIQWFTLSFSQVEGACLFEIPVYRKGK